MASKVWRPVEDGLSYSMGRQTYLLDGEPFDLFRLPGNIRLCQLVDAPAAVTIPEEVREAIRRLAAYGIPVGCANADWIRWRETVTKWLDAQPKGDGE